METWIYLQSDLSGRVWFDLSRAEYDHQLFRQAEWWSGAKWII